MLLYLHRNCEQIRTQMPRQSRKKSSTGIYHVMLRGINKQDVFEEEEDYVRMKEILNRLNEVLTGTVPVSCNFNHNIETFVTLFGGQ